MLKCLCLALAKPVDDPPAKQTNTVFIRSGSRSNHALTSVKHVVAYSTRGGGVERARSRMRRRMERKDEFWLCDECACNVR